MNFSHRLIFLTNKSPEINNYNWLDLNTKILNGKNQIVIRKKLHIAAPMNAAKVK